jgi:hypothetical protein
VVELQLLRGDERVHSVPVGDTQVRVGRAAGNELVLADLTVSGHHLLVWREPGALWLKDLGSTNGTFINERRIRGTERLRDGDRVRLGTTCTLLVCADLAEVHGPLGRGLVLEDLWAGTRFPLLSDRFVIGAGEAAGLRLPEGPAEAATLLVHPDGEVWVGTDEGERVVTIGAEFVVSGRAFRVLEIDTGHVATAVPSEDRYPYRLTVSLEGGTGPTAVLEHPGVGAAHRVESGNRAVLLWVLCRRVEEDRSKGIVAAERGWCSDDEVMGGVWGRHGDENKLNVLLHRLRAELRSAGFDPWFIEKKQRYIRARLSEVAIR